MEFDYGQCSKPAIAEDVDNQLSLHENWSDLCVIGCVSKKTEQIVRECYVKKWKPRLMRPECRVQHSLEHSSLGINNWCWL